MPFHRQMKVQSSRQERERAEPESHNETDQIEELPVHKISSPRPLPLLLRFPFSPPCPFGFSTWSNLSANPGVSKMAPSNTRHPRESACLATSSSARFTWGSRRNRSAPAISHRSRRSSSVRTSDISSV